MQQIAILNRWSNVRQLEHWCESLKCLGVLPPNPPLGALRRPQTPHARFDLTSGSIFSKLHGSALSVSISWA